MAEVARLLTPTGSVWLNLSDTYARHERHGAQPKSLVLGPERLLLALTASGWVLRNKVVWAKPNPMPASVRDRLTCTWEGLYLLMRSRHYYFDLDAARIPSRSTTGGTGRPSRSTKYPPITGRPSWSGPYAGNNAGLGAMKAEGRSAHVLGRNPGDVWTIPTASYRGAHFATFPEALVERRCWPPARSGSAAAARCRGGHRRWCDASAGWRSRERCARPAAAGTGPGNRAWCSTRSSGRGQSGWWLSGCTGGGSGSS